MTAQYQRWKYLIQHDYPVPIELDKAILDKMQGQDNFAIPLKDADLITAEKDLLCAVCGEKCGTRKVADQLEDQYWLEKGNSWCFLPAMHKDCYKLQRSN